MGRSPFLAEEPAAGFLAPVALPVAAEFLAAESLAVRLAEPTLAGPIKAALPALLAADHRRSRAAELQAASQAVVQAVAFKAV